MILNFLTNLKGVLVLALAAVNTIVWFTPLIGFTLFKLLIPVVRFRNLMTRWIVAMGENWISGNALLFGFVNGTTYNVQGLADLSREEWYLLVSNHQTWADIIALQTVLNRRIPFLKFFVKQELIWFPFLGVAFWALDMPFMKRYSKGYLQKHPDMKGKDLEITRHACKKFHAMPTSVINFIEGTRVSEEKLARRNSPFQYLLPPRSGGIAVTMSSMGSMFNAMLDITVFYPEGVPTFWDVMCGRFKAVDIYIRQQPVEQWIVQGDYVNDREYRRRFHRWLTALWEAKDAQLAELHAERRERE